MGEAHRPQITDLVKKHHSRLSDNAHKFKGTVVIDGGSILYTIIWRKENTFVCAEKLPFLGVLSQDGLRLISSRANWQLLKTQHICTGHREPRLG